MSNEFEQSQFSYEQPKRTQEAEFDEAPGEGEAETVRDAFLKNAGPQPAGVASALSSADHATRANAINRLQQERGNSYVQRVVAEGHGTPGRLVGQSQPEMVDEVLQRKGTGAPLPEGPRSQMEGQFGADLGGVRVHTDGEAVALNRELDAQAFTVGGDIFFDQGKYDPHSREGQGLLAHELTHVGQQGGFGAPAVQRESAEEDEKNKMQEPAAPPASEMKKDEEETKV